MQPFEHIVYFDSKEAVSSIIHEEINQESVDLRKQLFILGSGKWAEHNMHAVCPLIKEWRT